MITIGTYQPEGGRARKLELDPRRLVETKMLVTASSGLGKSYLLRVLLEQLGRSTPIIVLDREGEYVTLGEKLDVVQVGPPAEYDDDQILARLDADMNLLHVIIMAGRPGSALAMRKLELEHFRPGTPDNDNFNVVRVKSFAEMEYVVISVPIRFRAIVEHVLDETGMRLGDGVPHAISSTGVEAFPMKSLQAYTLENKPGSIVYSGSAARESAQQAEMDAIREVERKHYAWYRTLSTVHWCGRTWHRITDTRRPPNDQRIELMTQDGSAWYTTDPANPEWRPYPK